MARTKANAPDVLLQHVLRLFSDSDHLESTLLTDHMFVIASVTWAANSIIRRFRLQAFAIEGMTLAEAYKGNGAQGKRVHYYRCDHHPTMLGELFSHPTPHIHIHGNDSPRFGLSWDSNPIAAFLEFLYLNHSYDTWRDWAQEICARNNKEDTFQMIANLSKMGKLEQLTTEANLRDLDDVRRLLRSKRGGEMRCTLEHDAGKVLSYEL